MAGHFVHVGSGAVVVGLAVAFVIYVANSEPPPSDPVKTINVDNFDPPAVALATATATASRSPSKRTSGGNSAPSWPRTIAAG